MSRRRKSIGFVSLGALVGCQLGSCYSAELDLSPFVVGGSGGGPGKNAEFAGASGAMEALGGAGSGNCSDEPLAPSDEACLLSGPLTEQQCGPSDDRGWQACTADACGVCGEMLDGFPFYRNWHPCCSIRDCDASARQPCSASCPAPDRRDKIPPCDALNPIPRQ